MKDQKSIEISINEKVVDHEKVRKERLKNLSIFIILFVTMVWCHNISFEKTTNEAQTKETKETTSLSLDEPEVSSELVKAIITPVEKQQLRAELFDTTNKSEETTEGEEKETSTVEEITIEESTSEDTTIETTELTTEETTTEENTTEVETTVEETSNNTDYRYIIQSEEEWRVFTKCVEAEVTGDDPEGVDYDTAVKCKLHVAQVILNRVEHKDFPNNIVDVVYQPHQFSPVSDGRISKVEVSQSTIDACNLALMSSTEDTVYGSLYFRFGGDWSYLNKIFTDEVGHQFYTR